MFNGLNINGSALTAHKTFLDTVSNNIANINIAQLTQIIPGINIIIMFLL